MEDESGNMRKFKKPSKKSGKKAGEIKQDCQQKPCSRMRFVITNNKQNSWVDDLYAQEQLNRMERVFH